MLFRSDLSAVETELINEAGRELILAHLMVVIDRVSDDPYMAATGIYDVHRIANEEKLVPREWMNKDATNVTKDFVDYIKPLIQGDYQPIMVNGMPRHLVLNMKKGRKK